VSSQNSQKSHTTRKSYAKSSVRYEEGVSSRPTAEEVGEDGRSL